MFRRVTHQPEKIDKVLGRALKGLRVDRRIKEESVLLNWSKVVGDRIASYSNPLRVRDSILFVRVENASWRNELVFLKGKIIKELNHSVKANVIKDIVFTN
jgi:predicted nucleic acid-binding Zn ribbon protein